MRFWNFDLPLANYNRIWLTNWVSFRAKRGISDHFVWPASQEYQRCFASLNMTEMRCRIEKY